MSAHDQARRRSPGRSFPSGSRPNECVGSTPHNLLPTSCAGLHSRRALSLVCGGRWKSAKRAADCLCVQGRSGGRPDRARDFFVGPVVVMPEANQGSLLGFFCRTARFCPRGHPRHLLPRPVPPRQVLGHLRGPASSRRERNVQRTRMVSSGKCQL